MEKCISVSHAMLVESMVRYITFFAVVTVQWLQVEHGLKAYCPPQFPLFGSISSLLA